MEAVKKDIKNLKEVLMFGLAVEKGGLKMFAGGKFHPEELDELFPILQAAGPAFEDIAEVVPEVKDLDEAEAAELIALVLGQGIEGVVDNEKAVRVINKSLKVAVAAWGLIQEIRA